MCGHSTTRLPPNSRSTQRDSVRAVMGSNFGYVESCRWQRDVGQSPACSCPSLPLFSPPSCFDRRTAFQNALNVSFRPNHHA